MDEGISLGLVMALVEEATGADPAVIEQAVQDWLDAHPEATTTVADGSITEQKLAAAVAAKINQVSSLSDEIDGIGSDVTDLKSAIDYVNNSIFDEIVSKNVLNPDTVSEDSYFSTSSSHQGEVVPNTNSWAVSDFISVAKNDVIYYARSSDEETISAPNNFVICEYDSNGDFLSQETSSTHPSGKNYITYTVQSENAAKIRVAMYAYKSYYNMLTINEAPEEYIGYSDELVLKVPTKEYVDAADIAIKNEILKANYPSITYKGSISHKEIIKKTDANNGDAYVLDDDYMPSEIFNDVISNGDLIVSTGQPASWYKLNNPLRPGTITDKSTKYYDICIVGGGAGGVAAAYALKDTGLKVCIIEQLPTLGGTHCNAGVIQMLPSPAPDFLKTIVENLYNSRPDGNTLGLMNWDTSSYSVGDGSESTFTKLWRGGEINYGKAQGNWGNIFSVNPWSMQNTYYSDLRNKIDIYTHHKFISAEIVNGQVICVNANDTENGGVIKIFADYFIDATANIDLCRYGQAEGTDYFIGSDAKATYNEAAIYSDALSNKYAINNLGPSYLAYSIQGDPIAWPLPVAKPDALVISSRNAIWEVPPRYTLEGYKNNGYWYNNGVVVNGIKPIIVDPSIYADVTPHDFIDHGYDYAYHKGRNNAALHFKLLYPDGTHRFVGAMPLLAIRESYRAKCDYMMTQTDIETLATSQNVGEKHIIALSSWWADLHNTTGIDTSEIQYTQLFGIPYESIIPTAFNNVLIACRGYGASHIAASAGRLTKTMMCLGYAAGKAAYLAKSNGLADVRNVNIQQLQTNCGVTSKMAEIETYFNLI